MYHNAIYQGTLYLEKNPAIENLIIGISGGIDSALTAYLAKRTCASVGRGTKVVGVSIPIGSNKQDEIDRARLIGASMCDSFHEIDLTEKWKNINEFLNSRILTSSESDTSINIRRGNSKARLRMMYLYNLAHSLNGMVLSTDNLTEYYLGFWTLHGDVGDFGFIQDLWKTEVYGLAEWVIERAKTLNISGLQECVNAIPTDGLGITNSDLDQLVPNLVEIMHQQTGSLLDLDYKYLYFVVDSILINYISQNFNRNVVSMANDDKAVRSVIERHRLSEFKRNNPVKIPREKLLSK
jgi:NAD+ synthetase